jgi:tripartite-type tricarboxylate transporter receptor subunit TctC
MRTLTLLHGLMLAASTLLSVAPGQAQTYPNRPVKVVVPFAAGGVADITTRIVAEKLGDKLGQRFVVENAPGAGGIAAARSVLSAPPDGHTLLLVTNGTAISVPLIKSLPFDPLKDFTPISGIGNFDLVFVVNSESEFKTLGDFLKAVRAKPGDLNVGTIAIGSTQNLAAELFKSTAQLNFQMIPFRTTPEAVVALLRNDIQMVVEFPAALQAGLSDKKLHAIAATGPVSTKLLPGTPTAADAGVPGYEVTSWNSFYARTGTPPEIVAKLNAAIREVVADPDVKKRMFDLGIEGRATTPDEADARMRADIDKWGKVIEKAGIPKQ